MFLAQLKCDRLLECPGLLKKGHIGVGLLVGVFSASDSALVFGAVSTFDAVVSGVSVVVSLLTFETTDSLLLDTFIIEQQSWCERLEWPGLWQERQVTTGTSELEVCWVLSLSVIWMLEPHFLWERRTCPGLPHQGQTLPLSTVLVFSLTGAKIFLFAQGLYCTSRHDNR